jgi:hypothetical protein
MNFYGTGDDRLSFIFERKLFFRTQILPLFALWFHVPSGVFMKLFYSSLYTGLSPHPGKIVYSPIKRKSPGTLKKCYELLKVPFHKGE